MRVPVQLKILNFLRWITRFWFFWGLLAVVYSFSAALLLQPIFSFLFQMDVSLWIAWILILGFVVVSSLFLWGIPSFGVRNLFWEKLFQLGLERLYAIHHLRSSPFVLSTLAMVGLYGVAVHMHSKVLWVLLCQFGIQVQLFKFYEWVNLALLHHPHRGGMALLRGATKVFLFQILFVMVLGGVLTMTFDLRLLAVAVASVLGAVSVILEGDAGRPLLVNFVSLVAGTLAGALTLFWWPTVLIVFYFSLKLQEATLERLKSAPSWSEDVVLQ